MKFIERARFDIQHLEAYIIEDIPGRILVNNNTNGLYILTNSLKFPGQDIILLEGMKITRIYKKMDEKELILYCPENLCLIHLNLSNYAHEIIPLNSSFKATPLTPLYLWNDTICLLTSQENLYQVNFNQRTISPIDQTVASEQIDHTFFACWKRYKTYDLMQFFINEQFVHPKHQFSYAIVIVYRKNDQVIIDFFDPKHHHQTEQPNIAYADPEEAVQDVRFSKDTFLFIRKKRIDVLTLEDKKGSLEINESYIFNAVRFLDESNYSFVVLCGDTSTKHDQLRIYEIEHKDSKIIE
jgi:hypothetical protein